MATDPGISLQVAAAQPPPAGSAAPGSGGLGGVLGTVGALVGLRSTMAQFQARQQLGQIMATSPDLATGLDTATKDPSIAGFAGQALGELRAMQQTMIGTQGLQATQTRDALQGYLKAATGALADPSQLPAITKSQLSIMPPGVRGLVAPAIQSLQTSLLDGLPSDPDAARGAYNQRLIGQLYSAGIGSDAINGILGTPTTRDLPQGIQSGVQLPSYAGGTFAPANTSAKSLPPQILKGPYGPGGAETATEVGGMQGGGGGAPNALTAGVPLPGAAPAPANVLATGPGQSASARNTDMGKAMASYEGDLNDRVLSGANSRRNVDEIVDAAHSAATGGGADTFMKLGSALQAFGVSTPTVDKWANGSLQGSQVIDKATLNNTMSQLKQQLTGVGGSKINQQEFAAYLTKNPNLTTDPRAMIQIFNLWNDFYKRDTAEQLALDKYKSTGGDITRWPVTWQNSPFMKNFAPGEAISSEGVKGIAAGVTHQWVPGKGLVAVPAVQQ